MVFRYLPRFNEAVEHEVLVAMSEEISDSDEHVSTLQDAVIHRQRIDQRGDQRFRFKDWITLRETSRMAVVAEHAEIIDSNTGEIHHRVANIHTINKRGLKFANRYLPSTGKKTWIKDESADEIGMLRDFLHVVKNGLPEEEGSYIVIRKESEEDADFLAAILQRLMDPHHRELFSRMSSALNEQPDALNPLINMVLTNPDAAAAASATLNLARYTAALAELKSAIDRVALESWFQQHLGNNPWMFGSEYSEVLDIRQLVARQNNDFVVRRTSDSYIEIIEIKRPLATPLFNFDRSHESFYPSSDLSQVLGQVMNYLDELDASRDTIERRFDLSAYKVRAKIIIGLDGDQQQRTALRRLNSHLHRVEVITFDQLVRIAERVRENLCAILKSDASVESPPGDADEEWPF